MKTGNPRNLEELYDLIGTASRSITADDCEGFFAHVRTFVLKGIQGKEFYNFVIFGSVILVNIFCFS